MPPPRRWACLTRPRMKFPHGSQAHPSRQAAALVAPPLHPSPSSSLPLGKEHESLVARAPRARGASASPFRDDQARGSRSARGNRPVEGQSHEGNPGRGKVVTGCIRGGVRVLLCVSCCCACLAVCLFLLLCLLCVCLVASRRLVLRPCLAVSCLLYVHVCTTLDLMKS